MKALKTRVFHDLNLARNPISSSARGLLQYNLNPYIENPGCVKVAEAALMKQKTARGPAGSNEI